MMSTLCDTNRLQNITPVVLRDLVFDRIQLAILEKQLKQGDHIHEQELTQRLNVSRTPVREALVLLERDGLVTSLPNRGTFVRKYDEQDIQEIFTLRTALENLAAALVLPKLGAEHLAQMEANIDGTVTRSMNAATWWNWACWIWNSIATWWLCPTTAGYYKPGV